LIALLDITGPLVTSSANQPGERIANNIKEAYEHFGDKADFYINGGDLSNRLASTIIAIDETGLRVLRKGFTKPSQLLN